MRWTLARAASTCCLALLAGLIAWSGEVKPPWRDFSENPCPPPPPYQFSLGGLTPEQTLGLAQIPGVSDVHVAEGRTACAWQPFNNEAWLSRKKWIPGAENFYDYLAIKGKVGKTQWTHGGRGAIPGGEIISGTMASHRFHFHFDDFTLKRNAYMALYLHVAARPWQIEHEMLRGVIGQTGEVVSCGSGHAIVWDESRGLRSVTWQTSLFGYAEITESFDQEMVAAYIDRLGCVTTKEFKADTAKWIDEEIIGQLAYINELWNVSRKPLKPDIEFRCRMLYRFTDLTDKYGRVQKETPLIEKWTWLHNVREFLWANRNNFKFSPKDHFSIVLSDKDRYDPQRPPELPEELRDPPRPDAP